MGSNYVAELTAQGCCVQKSFTGIQKKIKLKKKKETKMQTVNGFNSEINSNFQIKKKQEKHSHLPLSLSTLFPMHLLVTTLGGR